MFGNSLGQLLAFTKALLLHGFFFQKGTALLHFAANDGIAETHINLLIRELEKQTEQNSLITIVKM